eukprot:386645_1
MSQQSINANNISFSGWLDKKSRHLGKWRKRWIKLEGGILSSFKTEKQETQTECIDLQKHTHVCKAGNLTFDIYNGNKVTFSFRAKTYNDKQLWIDTIIQALEKKHISSIPIQQSLFKQPTTEHIVIKKKEYNDSGSKFAFGSGLRRSWDEILIHTNLRLRKNELLRARFAKKTGEKHPELIIYGDEPEYDNDQVIRIDLVCINDSVTNEKQNKVRLQCKTWGEMKNRDCDELEFPILKSLKDITTFCVEYQKKNSEYSLDFNNCRKFMIELCKFLSIKYPDKYPFEETWYGLREASQIFGNKKKKDVKLKTNAYEYEDMSIRSIEYKMDMYDEKQPLDHRVIFEQLCCENILRQYSGNFFSGELYQKLKNKVCCFVEGHENIDDFHFTFLLLLVKLDEYNRENNRYFYYELKTSYEQLKIIDNTMKRKNVVVKKLGIKNDDYVHGMDRGSKTRQKIENVGVDFWIDRDIKPMLLHPDQCTDVLQYYAKYLQVLFQRNLNGTDYLFTALKLPDKLCLLLQAVKKKK